MKTTFLIIMAHALLILSSLFFSPPGDKAKKKSLVKVHTFLLQEERAALPQLARISHTFSDGSDTLSADLASQPTERRSVEKKCEKSELTPKSKLEKPVTKVAKPQKQPQLTHSAAPPKKNLQDAKLTRLLQETLASCDKQQHAKPKQIGSLSCEAILYQERLIAFLESHLTLPEKGEVGLSLTLNRAGAVQNIVLQGKISEKNRQFVEVALPTLSFPPFGNDFKEEKSHTFSITLTSS